MNNIFKRNKIYYFRSTLPQELKFYFDGKKEYIKSLRIKNINNAKIIARYLGKRLNLIKEEIKMLSHNEILKLIEEFKKISIVDIASRNSYLTQEEINEQLKELEKHNNIKLIEKEMQDAYCKLYELNLAHSVEVWDNDELIGGLYGVSLGKCFFGESMFSKKDNGSKTGFITLVNFLRKNGFVIIDWQVHTNYLESLGAEHIARNNFLKIIKNGFKFENLNYKWNINS